MNFLLMLLGLFSVGAATALGGSRSEDTVSPDSEPAPQPDSTPQMVSEPEPQPEPDHEPEMVSEPQPAPAPQTVSEPQPAPAPQTVSEPQPPLAPQTVSEAADHAETIAVDHSEAIDVDGGRVSTLSVGDGNDISSIRIIDKPDVGNVTVNPDNTLALVLSHPDARDFSGTLEFSYEISYADGSVSTITTSANVAESTQLDGFGEGDFYLLQTDDEGELIVEHGDNHRTVHVSGDDLALSRAEIAEIENLDVSEITGEWLASSVYGRSPDTALDDEAGRVVWEEITGSDSEPGSHWLLFEKGYEYDVGRLIGGGAEGESELHPLYISSYGEGTPPVLNGDLRIFQQDSANIVIRDIALGGDFQALEGGNYILDTIDNNGHELSFQNDGAVTFRNSTVTDSFTEEPRLGGDFFDANADRAQGIFINHSQGVLLENNFFDLNGFELDYDYNGSAEFGQPPSQFNHNIYVNRDAGDVTLRDNIILRGASFGAQIRPGGFIEDNVFAGNNIGVNTLGGRAIEGSDALTGNFTLYNGNVITTSGFNAAAQFQGATTWGLDNDGNQTSLVNNIIAHLVDPNSAPVFNENYDDGQRTQAITNINEQNFAFNDTIIYNWALANGRRNAEDDNTEGLNPDRLDQTTIQAFTADLLSQPDADLADLADFLRAQATDGLPDLVDADLIVRFFQDGFGITSPDDGIRDDGATLRFVPNALGDGIRWDNRLNWDSGDLPGTAPGDSVDLAGNWVIYGGSTTIQNLDFGSGGELTLTHGYLQVDGTVSADVEGGTFNIDNAGQLWINGYNDTELLEINVAGGRFANIGTFDGPVDLDVSDNAQAILAHSGAELTLTDDSSITITGSDADIGFDGNTGADATLEIETGARVNFVADADGFSTIREFRSGRYDQDGTNVDSSVAVNGGILGIDITALNGAAFQQTLIAADEIVGEFEEIELIGLADNQDATITFDYDTDTVVFNVTAIGEGSGQTIVDLLGTQDDSVPRLAAQDPSAVWAALTDGQGTFSDTDQLEDPTTPEEERILELA